MSFVGEWGPYLALILVGFLPTEVWRMLGLLISRGIDEGSEILIWVRAVATAILAGVAAQLILSSSGALAAIPLPVRIGAALVGFFAYLLIRRSVFAGVLAGEVALTSGIHPDCSAAASCSACSASTRGSWRSLAGGFIATPSLRGITCMWRWNTTWPPALSLNC